MDLVVSYGQIHLSLVASTVRFPALQVSRLILTLKDMCII